MASSKLSKTIVFKEENELVHQDKLNQILDQSLKVVRQFVKFQWPKIWPKLQQNFSTQSEFNREKQHFESSGIKINDLQMEHLDLSALFKLLQNGAASPVCGNKNPPPALKGLYEKAWTKSKDDLQSKFAELKKVLSKSANNNISNTVNGLKTKEILQIVQMSNNDDEVLLNLSSYLWLSNKVDGRPEEDMLDAPFMKHGVDGLLGVLKFVWPNFQPAEYSFVSTLSLLRVLRNKYAHGNPNGDYMPKATFDREFKLIHKCVENLLSLMEINLDELVSNDAQKFRSDIEAEIENIFNSSSYKCDAVYQLITLNQENPSVAKAERTISVSSTCNSQDGSGQEVTQNENAGNVDQAAFYCKVCNLQLNHQTQYDDHEKGKNHRKKLAQLNTVPPSPTSVPVPPLTTSSSGGSLDHSSSSFVNENSLQPGGCISEDALVSFIESFDPVKGLSYLRIRGIFTPSDCEIVRGQIRREDKVVEFLAILQTKENWFNRLADILEKFNDLELLSRLKNG